MAGKTTAFGGKILKLIFLAETLEGLAQNDATSPLTQFWVSLHTADPTDAGNQTSNEATYTGYARVAISRGAGAFSVTGDVLSTLIDLVYGKCTAGAQSITHVGFGSSETGAGELFYSGALASAMSVAVNARPILEAGTTITEG